jgi:hypothetical protein
VLVFTLAARTIAGAQEDAKAGIECNVCCYYKFGLAPKLTESDAFMSYQACMRWTAMMKSCSLDSCTQRHAARGTHHRPTCMLS